MSLREGYNIILILQMMKLTCFVAFPPCLATHPSQLASSTKPQDATTCGIHLLKLSGQKNLTGSLRVAIPIYWKVSAYHILTACGWLPALVPEGQVSKSTETSIWRFLCSLPSLH